MGMACAGRWRAEIAAPLLHVDALESNGREVIAHGAQLGEVQEGNAAGRAYLEAIAPETTAERRGALRQSLLEYFQHDTLAMVTVARHLEGR